MGYSKKHRNDYLADEVMRSAGADRYIASCYIEDEIPTTETINPETIEELIEYKTADEVMEEHEFRETMQNLLDSMTPRESKILRLRFGFDIPKELTLDEIASIFSVTRERIRQIEAKAFRKMRHPARSVYLQPLVNPDVSYYTPFMVLKEPPPTIEKYDGWGYIQANEWYIRDMDEWIARQEEAIKKINKAREELRK